MTAFADHGTAGNGEPLAIVLRPGSAGSNTAADHVEAIMKVPAGSWTSAYDGGGQVRDGAWVADITGMPDLSSWPAGMRVIVRRERPHPGA